MQDQSTQTGGETSSTPPLVSVFLLVKDEAETLERAISSVAELGPEIIVGVDRASDGATRAVAKEHACRVVEIDFGGDLGGDFAAARNLLNELGTGTWGLTLDGHEYLQQGHAKLPRELLELDVGAQHLAHRGIAFTLLMSEAEGGGRAMVLRCWKRSDGVRYERPVHERLVGLGREVLGRPDIVMHHDRPKWRIDARRAQRSTLDMVHLRRRHEAAPDDDLAEWHLAQLLKEQGQLDESRRLAKSVMASGTGRKAAFRVGVLLHLAQIELAESKWQAAMRTAREAMDLQWNASEAWAIAAQAAIGAGRVSQAVHTLQAMELLPPGPPELPVAVRYETWWPHRELGKLALSNGQVEFAAGCFKKALEYSLPTEIRNELLPWQSFRSASLEARSSR